MANPIDGRIERLQTAMRERSAHGELHRGLQAASERLVPSDLADEDVSADWGWQWKNTWRDSWAQQKRRPRNPEER